VIIFLLKKKKKPLLH